MRSSLPEIHPIGESAFTPASRVTEGGNHTKVRIGKRVTMVPRHREVSEGTARGIIKSMEEK